MPSARTPSWLPLAPAILATVVLATPLETAAQTPGDPPPPPRDPNDLPMMKAPRNQPNTVEPRLRGQASQRRKFALTISPAYAFLNLSFLGRSRDTIHGAGAELQADIQVLDFLWVRVSGSHTVHPVDDELSTTEDDVSIKVASRGLINATNVGLGLVWAMDLGRVLPLIDLGAGLMFMASPTAVQDGQMGGSCRSGGECDTGLRCDSTNVCRVGVTPELHLGIGFDVPLRDHFSIGAHFRYYALLDDPGTFPVYVIGALRLVAKF